ncbi:MAG: hypothetical protein Q7T21_15400 [Gallionella sp.]|nr:hypothetical protein [Gallionella sp.]
MATPAIRWHLVVIGLVALGLRLPLLGDQPYTDDGLFAATSYFIHLAYTGALGAGGWLLPKDGYLGLYQLLSSWVYFLPWEPFFLLRLIDAIVAAAAGMAVYRFLADALDDRPIAMVSALFFVLTVNHPVFINAGYKNSIMVAVTLTALALAALHRGDTKGCFQAGLFMAGAVLFREFFLPMAVVVTLYSIARCGWSGFLRFAAASSVLAAGVVAADVLLRGEGGFGALINSYFEYSSTFPDKTSLKSALKQGFIAADILLPLIPLVGIGLLAPALSSRYRNRESLDLYVLGILFALCPALEIWYKSPFPYHFSQSALGLAMLLALGLHVVVNYIRLRYNSHKSAAIVLGLFVLGANLLLFRDYARQYYWQADSAVRFIPVMIGRDWTSDATERSVYLRAARAIRENTLPAATMTTEYNILGLFPLTSRLPSVAGTGAIGRVLQRRDRSVREAEMAQLIDAPPDVFVLMPRTLFREDLGDFPLELTTRYSRRIDQGRGLSPYGGWSAEIYLR